MPERATIRPMQRTAPFISTLACVSLTGIALAHAEPDDPTAEPTEPAVVDSSPSTIDTTPFDNHARDVTPTRLRMQGIDLSQIPASPFDLPSFSGGHTLYTNWERSPLISLTSPSDGLTLGSSIRFDVGRSTALRDGGIAGSHGTVLTDSPDDQLPSIAQSEGEYDLYDLTLSWEAVSTGPFQLNLISGVKAIDGNINKRVTTNGVTTLQDARRVAALPIIGTGIQWHINDRFSISGSAQTHPINGSGSIVDINAMTAYSITDSMDLSIGYSMIRSTFDIGAVGTELSQEGLFARLQIRF